MRFSEDLFLKVQKIYFWELRVFKYFAKGFIFEFGQKTRKICENLYIYVIYITK